LFSLSIKQIGGGLSRYFHKVQQRPEIYVVHIKQIVFFLKSKSMYMHNYQEFPLGLTNSERKVRFFEMYW
jgi:hypothetical protein